MIWVKIEEETKFQSVSIDCYVHVGRNRDVVWMRNANNSS